MFSCFCILPVYGYSLDKVTTPCHGSELKALSIDEKGDNLLVIYSSGNQQWQWKLDAEPTKESESSSDSRRCFISYKTDKTKAYYPCVSDGVTAVSAYKIDSKSLIVNFMSERGGKALLFSVTTDNDINFTTIPYMTGDEDGIEFFYGEKNNIIAKSKEDNFILSPDEMNRYFIRKYEGSGMGFNIYMQ